MKTLVLDRSYLPQRVVPWQRAVSLLVVGKAELVDRYDELVHAPSLSMPMPSIVRVFGARRRAPSALAFSRTRLLVRDGFRCQYCGDIKPSRELTCDHVLPRSRGGASSWENLVIACRDCNLTKRNRTPEEAGMQLRKRPMRPSWMLQFRAALGPSSPASWAPFVGGCR